MKYTVIGIVDAVVYEEVEASSPEEAAENVSSPSLCHQCCREVEIGDIMFVRVLDEAGNEIWTDEDVSLKNATLEQLMEEVGKRKLK